MKRLLSLIVLAVFLTLSGCDWRTEMGMPMSVNDANIAITTAGRYFSVGEYEKALKCMKPVMQEYTNGNTCWMMAQIYEKIGDLNNTKKYALLAGKMGNEVAQFYCIMNYTK